MLYQPFFFSLIFVHIGFSNCFFAVHFHMDKDYRTRTHPDITKSGAMWAFDEYIVNSKGSYSMEDFFKDDSEGHSTMLRQVTALMKYVSDTQEERKETAYFHCHADQILLAHNFVKSCKQKIQDSKQDMDVLLRQLGECLYTVQSFYSNTNWVEMNGDAVYEDFGVNDLMPVASSDEDTCFDTDSIDVDCKQNILVQNKLTSGYHHARGNTKPTKPVGSATGKCSHGGKQDESRTMIAKCGINKESILEEWSPHHHLHLMAASAAVKATKHFLIAEGTGILHTLGEDIFDTLFHVKVRQPISLTFAIDYSGSMSNEIAGVKEHVIQLVTSTIGSTNEPSDYVLTLFNDPESLTKSVIHRDGYDMIQNVSDINVGGGGDCPEYSAGGIFEAIELSRNGSTVLTFTDASAKDANRSEEVIMAAQGRNISLTTILTGSCDLTRRKRRSVSTPSFYQEIADATGGKLYITSKSELGNILNKVLEDIFPSTEIIIDSYNWLSSSADDKFVVVDEAITVLKISITGAFSETDVDIIYADGTIETFTSGATKRLYTSNGEAIISLQNPPPSILKLRRNVNNNWIVYITAQSSLKADVELFQYTSNQNLISLQGSPVVGNNYSLAWTVYNLGSNGTCNTISIVDTTGAVISSYTAFKYDSEPISICSTDIELPEQKFKIKLDGSDSNGYTFSRKSSAIFQPSFAELIITASSDEVVVGHERSIGFKVRNTGSDTKAYTVSITDDHNFTLQPASQQHTINPGESVNETFTVKPNTSSVIFSYSVVVTEDGTNAVQQTITKKLVVTDVERPSCSVTSTAGMCGASSLNIANCSSYAWSSDVEVTFSGTQLNSITSTAGSTVTLTHDNITGLLGGPLTVNVKGTCCSPSVHINIIDTDGFIAQCELQFSDGRTVKSVVVTSTESVKSPDVNNTVIGIAVGVTGAIILIVVVVMVTRCYYNHKTKDTKVQDSSPNLQSITEDNKAKNAWTDIKLADGKQDIVSNTKFKGHPKSVFANITL